MPISGTARYVKVQLVGANYLSLAEVKVWGAPAPNSAQPRWLVTDQLGTPRMVLDKTGSLANVTRHDYLPFGEEVPANFRAGVGGYGTGDGVRQKFTGYERDNETSLNFAEARYYSHGQGRFTAVDPLMASARPGSPQSWNRYAYVLNNPLRLVDPTGLSDQDPNEQKREQLSPQQQVVNVEDSKVINQRVAEIRRNATPLPPGQQPVATSVEHIVGEEIQLQNATVNLPDGSQVQVAEGYMRAVGVVVLDQGGNIMTSSTMTITEKVTPADDNARALEKSGNLISNNQPAPQGSNGVFFDAQIRGMGSSNSTFSYQTTQDLTIKEGRKGLFKIEGVKITTDDKTRSIAIEPGKVRKFH